VADAPSFRLQCSKEESMKRLSQALGVVLVAAAVLALVSPAALAGRTGGPMSTVLRVPAGQSVYVDIPFDQGQAIVSIAGNGQTLMQVYIYDSDGHVATGVGSLDHKTAQMDVYRPGMLRVAVTNAGIRDNMVTFMTN